MTDLRKAAEMALKALNIQTPLNNREFELRNSAIEALRQALAQPEQEPVAWMLGDNFYTVKQCNLFGQDSGKEKPNQIPLYTAPPKREWVGLTDEEMEDLWDRYAHMEMMRTIEAKLKEKNT